MVQMENPYEEARLGHPVPNSDDAQVDLERYLRVALDIAAESFNACFDNAPSEHTMRERSNSNLD